MGNEVEMESDGGGMVSSVPHFVPSASGTRPVSEKLLLTVLGESFSGSVVVSEGLRRSEEAEEELQSDLTGSVTGDKNAIPPLLW